MWVLVKYADEMPRPRLGSTSHNTSSKLEQYNIPRSSIFLLRNMRMKLYMNKSKIKKATDEEATDEEATDEETMDEDATDEFHCFIIERQMSWREKIYMWQISCKNRKNAINFVISPCGNFPRDGMKKP